MRSAIRDFLHKRSASQRRLVALVVAGLLGCTGLASCAQAPTSLAVAAPSAVAGIEAVTVSWRAPTAPAVRYQVRGSDSRVTTCAKSPCVVGRLVSGARYSFQVAAISPAGTRGPWSPSSRVVIPASPPAVVVQAPSPQPPAPTYIPSATHLETVGGLAHTWTNWVNAGGYEGPQIQAFQSVEIACKLPGFRVADGNTWWYRIASAPWNNGYYVSADAFYNNGATSGTLSGTPFVDPAVPDCPQASSGGGTATSPKVSLARGPIAPAGYRYAINLAGFPAASTVSLQCYDSQSPDGFYLFFLQVQANGAASTQSYCYSGDGLDHWVIANGRIESNHVSWNAASGGGGSTGGTPTSGPAHGGSTPTAVYSPTHIRLSSSAGEVGGNLVKLASNLNAAASRVGLDAQTLAHVIYHEGGNYLTWRKSATQLIELNAPLSASVGIGQIKPATAKLVALQVYRDWETVLGEDVVVHTNLIYNTDYSLKFAAGYLRLMRMSGIDGDYNLFMCYAISIDAAKAWKSTRYSLDTNVLTSIGLIPNVMQQRAKFHAEAVAAIS